MKTIKFRAWDEMADCFCYFEIGGIWTDFQQEIYARLCISGAKFEQFTGLFDKNGIEIFSKDVVRILYTDWASQTPDENGNYPMSLEDYKKSKSIIGYVDWDDHSTGWVIMTKSKYSVNEEGTVMTSIIHGTHGEREKIGNIHQNPELL